MRCYASPYGVGVVLLRRLPLGEEKPRALFQAEKKYSQLDKEALAIKF